MTTAMTLPWPVDSNAKQHKVIMQQNFPVENAQTLVRRLRGMHFAAPVAYVYNPLEYAAKPYAAYMARYGQGRKKTLLLGMNPGPFGMAQTGVPFGAVPIVRDWLDIEAPVGRPPHEHPKRTIEGFACARTEVSGMRLWGWAQEQFGTPERFFARFMVYNYCPLVFMEDTGKNRTPDKLPVAERAALFAACDAALCALVQHWEVAHVVGVGAFAAQRARVALVEQNVQVGQILHPSPASPLANRGWAAQVTEQLIQMRLLPIKKALAKTAG